jgi:hypothetical protein
MDNERLRRSRAMQLTLMAASRSLAIMAGSIQVRPNRDKAWTTNDEAVIQATQAITDKHQAMIASWFSLQHA